MTLGLDVGTQGTKALIVDVERGEVIGRGHASYGLIEGLGEGHMEQHPSTWIDAIQSAVRAAGEDAETAGHTGALQRVEGIGVSGQQHGAVLLDASHRPVRAAKLWCDTSTAAEAKRVSESLGRAIPSGFTAPKLRYVADREPDVWASTAHAMLPHDFVNLWLTGEVWTEPGDASGTGYLSDSADAYLGADLLETVAPDLGRRLPRIVPSVSIGAPLRRSAAEALGLREGIGVSGGGGDNMMSAIGSGATSPGVVTCSLGTSGTVFAYSTKAVLDPGGAIAAFRSSSETDASAAGHLPLLCIMNCTEVLNRVCSLTGRTHDELTLAASKVPFGADGLLLLPYLVGERVPDLPDARASLTGLTDRTLNPAHLYRAALEGVSLGLSFGLDRMRELGLEVGQVRLVGGAAGNLLWRQILADLFDCRVDLVLETETAALGGALQAASALGGNDLDALAARIAAVSGDAAAPRAASFDAAAELRARFNEESARRS